MASSPLHITHEENDDEITDIESINIGQFAQLQGADSALPNIKALTRRTRLNSTMPQMTKQLSV